VTIDLSVMRHTARVGWRALRHRVGAYHWPEPRWLWAYPWEGSGVYVCRRCDREAVGL
jgi:hypothetical protein